MSVCRILGRILEGEFYGHRGINHSAFGHRGRVALLLLEERTRLAGAHPDLPAPVWGAVVCGNQSGYRSIHLLDVLKSAGRLSIAKLYFALRPIITNSPPSRPPDRSSRDCTANCWNLLPFGCGSKSFSAGEKASPVAFGMLFRKLNPETSNQSCTSAMLCLDSCGFLNRSMNQVCRRILSAFLSRRRGSRNWRRSPDMRSASRTKSVSSRLYLL